MGSDKTSIGDRFKGYENASRYYLTGRLPVIIRLDGKAFHTLTKHLDRPFDEEFVKLMVHTAVRLCESIQTCEMAYVQSDEISLLLVNHWELNTEPWFGNNKSKMESISASIAAAHFNIKAYKESAYGGKIHQMGYFDSRAFIIPAAEVCNYFIWRQQDATRNAVQMAAQSMFSHKFLQNLNNDQLHEKMFQERGINFNDYPVRYKRGTVVKKVKYEWEDVNAHDLSVRETIERNKWEPDLEIPIFTQDRNYIEQYVPEYNEKGDRE